MSVSRIVRNGKATRFAAGVVMIALVGLASGACTSRAEKRTATEPSLPEFRRGGEILMLRGDPREGGDLIGVDPDTGATRTLVAGAVAPPGSLGSRIVVGGREIQGMIGHAVFSPDGRWLAFDTGLKPSLWVMNAELQPRQLAVTPGLWAWSPTDAQLAMIGRSRLTLIDASTGRKTNLGATLADDDTTGPVWSPDGTRIVFGVRGGSIYFVDVGSGERSLLVQLPGELDSIDGIEWSPEGAHVAILADLVHGLRRLYLMNADGSGLRVLVDEFEPGGWGGWFPDNPSEQIGWSPDGTRLTYPAFSGSDEQELRIWTVALDGSAPSLVASRPNGERGIDGGSPVWSPDGSQIAFETGRGRIVVVSADGTDRFTGTDHLRSTHELTYLSWRGGSYFCFCYG